MDKEHVIDTRTFCPECNKHFRYPRHFMDHQKKAHSNSQNTRNSHPRGPFVPYNNEPIPPLFPKYDYHFDYLEGSYRLDVWEADYRDVQRGHADRWIGGQPRRVHSRSHRHREEPGVEQSWQPRRNVGNRRGYLRNNDHYKQRGYDHGFALPLQNRYDMFQKN